MDRPISTNEQRKSNAYSWLRYLVLIAILIAGYFGFKHLLKTKVEQKDFRTTKVEQGDIENTITATGTIIPSFERQINAPVTTEIKSVLLKSGTTVKPGDLMMELDEEFIRLNYESEKDLLELKKNNITRLQLEYNKNLRELEYNDQIKALELSSKEAALADIQRLKEIGSATQEEVEKANLDLQIVKLEKKKLENNLDFRKKVLNSDQRNLELEVMIKEKEIRELQRKLNETSVKAPAQGVVTWINESIGKKVTEGEALVRLANLESFRVEASCSDRYSNLVKVGMSVNVRINKARLNGTISSILPAVENNTLEFVIELESNNHKMLRPNMRVEVFIISDKKEQVIRVANGPAFTGARTQKLFVIRGDQAISETVTIGLTNMNFVEIVSGNIRPGDQVIISEMKDYDHLNSIELTQ